MIPNTGEKKPSTKRVPLSLDAPTAKSVRVSGSFCDWQTQSHALKRDKAGVWRATLSLPPGTHEYRFLVDGQWHDDPKCRDRIPNPFGTENCLLHVLREGVQEERSKVAIEGTG
jgi:1,4-alpha-glucan branching enzyme